MLLLLYISCASFAFGFSLLLLLCLESSRVLVVFEEINTIVINHYEVIGFGWIQKRYIIVFVCIWINYYSPRSIHLHIDILQTPTLESLLEY